MASPITNKRPLEADEIDTPSKKVRVEESKDLSKELLDASEQTPTTASAQVEDVDTTAKLPTESNTATADSAKADPLAEKKTELEESRAASLRKLVTPEELPLLMSSEGIDQLARKYCALDSTKQKKQSSSTSNKKRKAEDVESTETSPEQQPAVKKQKTTVTESKAPATRSSRRAQLVRKTPKKTREPRRPSIDIEGLGDAESSSDEKFETTLGAGASRRQKKPAAPARDIPKDLKAIQAEDKAQKVEVESDQSPSTTLSTIESTPPKKSITPKSPQEKVFTEKVEKRAQKTVVKQVESQKAPRAGPSDKPKKRMTSLGDAHKKIQSEQAEKKAHKAEADKRRFYAPETDTKPRGVTSAPHQIKDVKPAPALVAKPVAPPSAAPAAQPVAKSAVLGKRPPFPAPKKELNVYLSAAPGKPRKEVNREPERSIRQQQEDAIYKRKQLVAKRKLWDEALMPESKRKRPLSEAAEAIRQPPVKRAKVEQKVRPKSPTSETDDDSVENNPVTTKAPRPVARKESNASDEPPSLYTKPNPRLEAIRNKHKHRLEENNGLGPRATY
ncbi:hypothetical protein OHC33_006616 [Knufia fluminis]|uniref:Uncharacterized protein n=1 Tax=Knufia fluminis TaxID=191047 RepID=A0AAN8I4T8_9EURO|nr:hypothetical protein OHC33_006616 [Knufia fluminis]